MENLSRPTSATLTECENSFSTKDKTWTSSDSEELSWVTNSRKRYTRGCLQRLPLERLRLFGILALVAIGIFSGILYLQTTISRGSTEEVWIAYPVAKSQGPLIQLRIEESNSSEWVTTHEHHQDTFAFRIDDQTLIPKELLSPQETYYQDWFRKFYPQLSDIYSAGQHLDEQYLGAASTNLIHVDLRFHLSHCVLALRRYWQARESGTHVCARDLDPGHMAHCLDTLDEWAFPPSGIPPKHNVYLEWITQVCEYEP